MSMTRRRALLQALGAATMLPYLPRLALAGADTDARFVLVILRGAVDGLALAPPFGDTRYVSQRGELAIDSDDLLRLDNLFGLHPSLAGVHAHYEKGNALLVHAVASPYRERSHFDGQDMLESGAAGSGALRDGWLNRALTPLRGDAEVAIALAQNTPLVLRGDNSSTSWAPSRLPDADDTTIARLRRLYAADPFFATRLEQALNSQEIASDMSDAGRRRGNEAQQFAELARAAANFLVAPAGPRIAVLELGGWDTHANQGAARGALANQFAALDRGLDNLRQGLGGAWSHTVVAVVTEFGRTVRVNGTRGTDHGTATAALLLGGAVNGGRVVADWPGLDDKQLYGGRDLRPTMDLRGVFKSILEQHLELLPGFVANTVFPDSKSAKPLPDLVRS
jgi:uncharacterized protein (DUF1501 family)